MAVAALFVLGVARATGPGVAPFAVEGGAALEARAGGAALRGFVPEFRAASRDRLAGEVDLRWRPAGDGVRLGLSWAWLSDSWVTGRRESGPGDLRASADARLWEGPADAWVGWEAKMPNADEGAELGTDETDVEVRAALVASAGRARLAASGGLAVLGNPLLFADQDDVPVAWLAGRLPVGPFAVEGRTGGAFATSRNPSRMLGALGLEGRCPWLWGGEVMAGFTPAAPDVGARLWFGRGRACPG